MNIGIRLIGAILILAGCTGIGFSAASLCRTKAKVIQSFLHLLDCMMTELGCRVTPLPELCKTVASSSVVFRETMLSFSETLDSQIAPNPMACMDYALPRGRVPCPEYTHCLRELAGALGCYDLYGQMRQLEGLKGKWSKKLEHLENDLAMRVRYFRVLGICAGCALAILLV